MKTNGNGLYHKIFLSRYLECSIREILERSIGQGARWNDLSKISSPNMTPQPIIYINLHTDIPVQICKVRNSSQGGDQDPICHAKLGRAEILHVDHHISVPVHLHV